MSKHSKVEPEPREPFALAVLGDASVAGPHEVRRLVELLVCRHRHERPITLLTPGSRGAPEVLWAHQNDWTVQLVPPFGWSRSAALRHAISFAVYSDAVLVLGDPGPWHRLLALCDELGTPYRVYRTLPRLPRPRPEGHYWTGELT